VVGNYWHFDENGDIEEWPVLPQVGAIGFTLDSPILTIESSNSTIFTVRVDGILKENKTGTDQI
jgi:hypothetical protein